jgi:hypothetical protein
MLAKKTSKNQITIPREIAGQFPDAAYFDVSTDDGKIVLRPVRFSTEASASETARLKLKKLGITERDVEKAVAWARKSSKHTG